MRSIFKACLAVMLITVANQAMSEDKEWADLYKCADIHIKDVAHHVVSLDEGAMLIVQNLCSNESTVLVNHLVHNRADVTGDFATKFNTYMSVIQRELRGRIYRVKLNNF